MLASVAAILFPMWPDLPIPVTTMRPWQLRIILQASTNLLSTRSINDESAFSSVLITAFARVFSLFGLIFFNVYLPTIFW